MAATLSVNLNAVAMLRNRRDLPWPDVIHLGRIALRSGAAGLTVHPRPDQRHVRFSDLPAIRELIDAEFPAAEFNIEGYPTEHFLQLCEAARADQVTLVPDDPAQATSDHGWDFGRNAERLTSIVDRLKTRGARVSLFADPSPEGLDAAARTGADRVEFFTGPYGATHSDPVAAERELAKLHEAGEVAARVGLGINAGHDLTIANLPPLCRALPRLAEVSIGHALTADALEHGFAGTIERFLGALRAD